MCTELDGFCHGGDGFAFVIKKWDPSMYINNGASTGTCVPGQQCGTSPESRDIGKNLGYAGIENSIAIEFDTWFTKDYYDPKQVNTRCFLVFLVSFSVTYIYILHPLLERNCGA